MTFEILLVYVILATSLVLFFTSWVRMDVVALLVLSILAITGLVTPAEALSGFSNPAVITVWAMFILSAALYQTGVARIIGRQVIYLAGKGEMRMIITIMLISGLLSSIMNNTGVAALMLPVVMDIARSTQRAPSRLLMPLAFGILLGGLTTMIGTPPNLLASFALQDAGLEPFQLFDYTPIGVGALLGGIAFIALIGRHLLPRRDITREQAHRDRKGLSASYALQERSFLIRLKSDSALAGKTLSESRFRAGLGINVLSIKRKGGGTILDPGPDTVLRDEDNLFVQGRLESIKAIRQWKIRQPEEIELDEQHLNLSHLNFFEATIDQNSPLVGQLLSDTRVRKLIPLNLLAIKQKDKIRMDKFFNVVMQPSDVLLLHGDPTEMDSLLNKNILKDLNPISLKVLNETYQLSESLFIAEITQESELVDNAIASAQLEEALGLSILGILRPQQQITMPGEDEKYQAGDRLIVRGNTKNLPLLQELGNIEFLADQPPGTQTLEEGEVQIAEAVLAPRSQLAGKTLPEINFRKRYGLTVLAIWREGRVFRTNLHQLPLSFGEAFLLYGKRSKLELLGDESDFILLTDTMKKPLRTNKALTSIMIMVGILIPVLFGLIPLAIMVIVGIILMVLSGCLKMEEAYRAIDWRSVFLIAGLLPLGVAMHQTGAAALMAEGVVGLFGHLGPWGVIAGLYLLTMFSTLVIPPAALVVVMSPVALQAAANFGISPHTMMMALVMAAAPSFMSPVSQPANLMMMGPGGYKFIDYIRLGLPLSLVVMAIVMLLLPIFWPI